MNPHHDNLEEIKPVPELCAFIDNLLNANGKHRLPDEERLLRSNRAIKRLIEELDPLYYYLKRFFYNNGFQACLSSNGVRHDAEIYENAQSIEKIQIVSAIEDYSSSLSREELNKGKASLMFCKKERDKNNGKIISYDFLPEEDTDTILTIIVKQVIERIKQKIDKKYVGIDTLLVSYKTVGIYSENNGDIVGYVRDKIIYEVSQLIRANQLSNFNKIVLVNLEKNCCCINLRGDQVEAIIK